MRKRKITFDQVPAALVEIMERLAAIESTLKSQKSVSFKSSQDGTPKFSTQEGTIDAYAASKLIGRTKVTLYNMAKSGKIPALKRGRNWLFVESEIEEWLQKPKVRKKRAQTQPAAATGKRRGRKKKVQTPEPEVQ